jgi:hypothetical protein
MCFCWQRRNGHLSPPYRRKSLFVHRKNYVTFVVLVLTLETDILPRIFTYIFPVIPHSTNTAYSLTLHSWNRQLAQSSSQFHVTHKHSTEKKQKNVCALSHCCWPILYYSKPERQIMIALWMRKLTEKTLDIKIRF